MAATIRLRPRLPRPRLQLRARPRLHIALAVGIAAALAAPGHVGATLRAVIGWDAGIATFLALALGMAATATQESMQRRAALEDQARWVFLGLMAAAALFSMFAVLDLMHEAHSAEGHLTVELSVLAGATILLSWSFAHTVFAVHYAHDYYGDVAVAMPPPLLFPGEQGDPDYWDFLYFSFVVGMTCQVSDVQVATQPWRRLVLAHGLLSFLYNTVVLALSINLLAGLL
jgi:uncharacterized membrane protein